MRHLICWSIAIAAMLAVRADAKPCWRDREPRTLLDTFFDADIVAVAKLQNAVEPNNDLPSGQVEIGVDEVLKSHPLMKDAKKIVLPRHRSADGKLYLMAMEVFKGQIDPYHAWPIDADGEMVRYVRGGLKLKDKSHESRMLYSLDFLHSPCIDVVTSANIELLRADPKSVRKVAVSLKPAPFLKSLQSSATPIATLGTHATLLGYCGKKEHAITVRKLIDASIRNGPGSHLSGLMFGYVLLDRDAGWDFVVRTAGNQEYPFLVRYSAFRTMREFGDDLPHLMGPQKIVAGIATVLADPEMADFAVEALRKWKRWEYARTILALPGKKQFDTNIMRRAVLRYALQCPTPRAQDHVEEQRLLDPELVDDTIELLKLEGRPTYNRMNRGHRRS